MYVVIILLVIIIVFIIFTPYQFPYIKKEGFEEEQTCPCNCEQLSQSLNNICEYPMQQLRDCESKILNFRDSCEKEKHNIENVMRASSNTFDIIKDDAEREAAEVVSQLEDCKKLGIYLEDANTKIHDDNMKRESKLVTLQKQLKNVINMKNTCNGDKVASEDVTPLPYCTT